MNKIIIFFVFAIITTILITVFSTIVSSLFGVQQIYLNPFFSSFNIGASVLVGLIAVHFLGKNKKDIQNA